MNLRHPIGAVAKLTGIPLDTLRAWERRYQAVTPKRSDRRRVYSDQQVQRLVMLRDAVARGHSIGKVALMPDSRLRAMLEKSRRLTVKGAVRKDGKKSVSQAALEPVLEAVENFDFMRAERELARLAMAASSPRDLVHQVALPLMRITGERWHEGAFTVAQEHIMTSLLSGLLASMLRLFGPANPPARVLMATPENEFHGFGILAAAMLTAAGGLGVIHLGTSLPARDVVHAAKRTEADVVLLGLCGAKPAWVLPALREIQERSAPRTQLWAGGAPEDVAYEAARAGWTMLDSFEALEHRLGLLGARF